MIFLKFLSKQNKDSNNIYSYQQFCHKKKLAQKLKYNLIDLLDGNSKKADELIARARFADPGKSDSYYFYKATINLKRTR